MKYLPIYPMFHIGDKVETRATTVYSREEGRFSKYDVIVKGIVREIIISKCLIDGSLIYNYKLDDDKIYSESNLSLRTRD